MCVTDCHDMTLAVKVALNPNTTNQLELNPLLLVHGSFTSMLHEPTICCRRLLGSSIGSFEHIVAKSSNWS